MPTPDRVRFGILGTARIALEKVVPGLLKAPSVEVTAIASRTLEAAQAAARRHRLPRAHGSYEALLADPDVDAVYVPLPNHLHVPWSIRALEAGKHVLCEKPIGLDVADALRLQAAAADHPHLRVMEAFMYRFHPQWQETRRLVRSGAVGALQSVHAHFSYRKTDPGNIRNRPEMGGGGLMDIGVYAISLARLLFDAEPRQVAALVEHDPDLGVDRLASALLDFGAGRTATFTCGTQMVPYQTVQVFGATGRLQLEIPFNAPQDGPARLWHQSADGTLERTFDRVDQYALQGEAFARAILDDTPVPTPLADAVAIMRVVEAVFASARRGAWVPVDGG